MAGVNLPWIDWGGDFGSPANGVRTASKQANLESRFGDLQSRGVHAVRWWMLEGDALQILRDGSGMPTGLDPEIYPDIDAALALADRYDLVYTFVLFSSPDGIPKSWMENAAQRSRLAEVLTPLFARYAGNPRILAWEVFNEPEWAIWNGRIGQADAVATVAGIVAAIHANSTAVATIGSAHMGGIPIWTGVGLDYYDAHWYDGMRGGDNCALCVDYATLRDRYGIDKPIVIGEFFAASTIDPLTRWEAWYDKGFAGAWGWSIRPARDGMTVDLGSMETFIGGHADIGPSLP